MKETTKEDKTTKTTRINPKTDTNEEISSACKEDPISITAVQRALPSILCIHGILCFLLLIFIIKKIKKIISRKPNNEVVPSVITNHILVIRRIPDGNISCVTNLRE
ncbi:hypothetical protein NEPAR06_2362 [Nematocida parisii]|uniref:Uncharacterized protein n=1 Tax=Nematocida parisii (strain ERTm3) TaxID=935791 RepID=I3EJT6_NEMP3|nr:uncharacterized protein NEPG_00989 [Nematocida parisii ERTm1]EIJ89483.1 hypothetical protein NEQG_00253 [Nematocida parisii ERTm3]EIJ94321.1 hypothetical protein NEPG_00989 [Nematocida parisii ERTm1]KAI5157041.1 hypothetical protein NEPAR06_2362 [Nematocida parisii]KAI5159055.1 hypothetical protein NEPAR05_2395 [Nematocida parisii]|eukprot:XP_013058817.1 hypothetical protein NEPG_00989 [Nematocida parisii ERTm1]